MTRNPLLPNADTPIVAQPVPFVHGAGHDGDGEQGGKGGTNFETGTATKTRPKTKRPNLYRVLLLNDD